MTIKTSFRRAWRLLGPNGRVAFFAATAAFITATAPLGAPPRRPVVVPQELTAPETAPQARLLLRTGDRAPVQARVDMPWGFARLPDGALVYVTGDESAVELRESPGQARILLNTGDRIPDCGTVSDILQVAAGADGTIAVRIYCMSVEAILRLDAAGGPPVTALHAGMPLPIGGGPYFIGWMQGPAVDGEGRIVVAVHAGSILAGGPMPVPPPSPSEVAALVRQSAGAPPEVLLQTGDPLGTGTFVEALREPAVNSGGMLAFSARITGDREVIATLSPGGAPEVLTSIPEIALPPGPIVVPPLALSPPALNDSGVVAFLQGEDPDPFGYPQEIRVLRAEGGAVETVAMAGDPAPDGDTFLRIDWVYPAVEASGAVLFGATRTSTGAGGLYRFDSAASAVAEMGQETGGGETMLYLGGSLGPLACADGEVLFLAFDTAGPALLAARDGRLSVELRPGEPMAEPARFVRFDGIGFPFVNLTAGPDMARGGAVIFDAWASGRGRGLYARAADGTLSAVALEGDPAPGGGSFDGNFFSFHSIADGGHVAFLGAATGGPRPGSLHLFAGVLGGPLTAVVGEGDSIPGFDAPVASLLPPSRIHASGAIALPVVLSDARTVLLGWDGAALHVIAASGDILPDGETIETLQTGQPDALLPPLLEASGDLLFGVIASGGHAALYRTPVAGGIASAIRVLGDGDRVEGGVLQPFLLQALSSDAAGRLAFQAVAAPGPGAATYLSDGGGAPRRVAGPGDVLQGPAAVITALPRLAATAGGVVHETSTALFGVDHHLWFATPRASPGSGPAFDQTPLNQGGMPSPDGGSYIGGGSIGPGVPGFPGGRPSTPERLGSDGDRYAVTIEKTTVSPEILVLFDLRPNRAPVADAGADQILECAGPGGARVTLDGRASSDPDNDPLEYTWTGPFGTASGPTPAVTLPLGVWTIGLTVRDSAGESAADTVVVTVRDTVAPTITVRALPDQLWPPDGRMAPVAFAVAAQDLCDAAPGVVLQSIASDDPKADLLRDVSGAAYGTDDRAVALRARRSGGAGGRTYTVTYVATDHSGNRAGAAATVLVPHDRGR